MTLETLLVISVLVFIVASLYSSVGHGGASGYLAVLSFFAVTPAVMSSTALVLNVLVAGVAMLSYYRAGHLSWKLSLPFIILSIPMAFLGGLLRISDRAYFLILAVVLVIAAFRLAISVARGDPDAVQRNVSWPVSLPVGGGIGLLSGIVGVGGGIFLSPVMLLMRWANAKKTSATSAFFIVVNSLAGIGGRVAKGGLEFVDMLPLVVAAFLGGLAGSHFGANKFSGIVLRRLLAVVLVVASIKLVLASI
jgi:uncharacterized membrane protein YfcA